jgi:hypothetical protein
MIKKLLLKRGLITMDDSECCGASLVEGTDLCSQCLEHTGQEVN